MHFNLADLFENVADHVPDREAIVYGDRRITFARGRRARDEARALSCRRRASGRATTSGSTCTTATSTSRRRWRRSSSARRRSTSTSATSRRSCGTSATTPTSSRWSSTASSRRASPRCVGELPALKTLDRRRGRADVAAATARSRPLRGASSTKPRLRDQSPARDFGERVGRRPLPPLHRRHDGHAEGRDVAARGRVLRRAAGRQPGRPPTSRRRSSSARTQRANANPTVTLPVAPLMHGNGHWASMIGTARRRQGRARGVAAARRARDLVARRARARQRAVDRRRRDGAAAGARRSKMASRAAATYDTVVAVRAVVGRRAVLGGREGAAAREERGAR